ncbi:MAG: SPOR domain-containing protein [Sphingomicrobium sp.]
MRTITLLAALLVSAPAPADAQSASLANDSELERDSPAEIGIPPPALESADSDARFNLRDDNLIGRHGPLDESLAESLESAARNGNLKAQATLGILLFNSGDRVGGLPWLKLAADAGEPRALLIYGTALFNGEGVARNAALAYAMVSRAAARGLAPANILLAQMNHVLPLEQRRKGAALARRMRAKPRQIALAVSPTSEDAAPPPPTAEAPHPRMAATPPMPKAESAPLAAAPSPAGEAWRVQLGAFGKSGSAQALFKRLASERALTDRQAYFVPLGAITRLQVGPFPSHGAAAAACALLDGHACFVVEAK